MPTLTNSIWFMHWWIRTNCWQVCKGRRQFVEWDSRMMPMWQKTLIIWIVLNIPCLRMGIVKKGSSLLRFFSLSRDFLTESMYHDVLIIQLCYLQNLHSHWFLHQSRKTLFYLAQDDSNIILWHWIISVGSGSTSHCNSFWHLISHCNSKNFVITPFLNLSNISIKALLWPLFVCGISTPSFGRHCHLLVVILPLSPFQVITKSLSSLYNF
mgnify:CR=1 FL=1